MSGAFNDRVALWINPDSSSFGDSAPTATLTAQNGIGGALDLTDVNRVFLRQDSSTTTPQSLTVDELRVGTSFADVTPVPEPRFYGTWAAAFLGFVGAFRIWNARRR